MRLFISRARVGPDPGPARPLDSVDSDSDEKKIDKES